MQVIAHHRVSVNVHRKDAGELLQSIAHPLLTVAVILAVVGINSAQPRAPHTATTRHTGFLAILTSVSGGGDHTLHGRSGTQSNAMKHAYTAFWNN